jgi:hypothetical protein
VDCQETQDSILESLVEPLDGERRLALEDHVATCSACSAFSRRQIELDARLAAVAPAARLSSTFRVSLRAAIRRDPASAWPDFLPDVAHLAGCAGGIGLSVFLLPFRPGAVLLAGAALTGATYFFQAVLRSSLDRSE